MTSFSSLIGTSLRSGRVPVAGILSSGIFRLSTKRVRRDGFLSEDLLSDFSALDAPVAESAAAESDPAVAPDAETAPAPVLFPAVKPVEEPLPVVKAAEPLPAVEPAADPAFAPDVVPDVAKPAPTPARPALSAAKPDADPVPTPGADAAELVLPVDPPKPAPAALPAAEPVPAPLLPAAPAAEPDAELLPAAEPVPAPAVLPAAGFLFADALRTGRFPYSVIASYFARCDGVSGVILIFSSRALSTYLPSENQRIMSSHSSTHFSFWPFFL